mmetsp:Transcript_4278/g.9258  ORF Transcript_4278/g.9258 Transcript_4278/m.9258 type:complete len:270 (+) Transcript_4278:517-1326(+)
MYLSLESAVGPRPMLIVNEVLRACCCERSESPSENLRGTTSPSGGSHSYMTRNSRSCISEPSAGASTEASFTSAAASNAVFFASTASRATFTIFSTTGASLATLLLVTSRIPCRTSSAERNASALAYATSTILCTVSIKPSTRRKPKGAASLCIASFLMDNTRIARSSGFKSVSSMLWSGVNSMPASRQTVNGSPGQSDLPPLVMNTGVPNRVSDATCTTNLSPKCGSPREYNVESLPYLFQKNDLSYDISFVKVHFCLSSMPCEDKPS